MGERPTRVLVIVVGVIVLLAVAAAVLSATRPDTELSRGTPERTVQAYLQAVSDGDTEEAAELIEPGSDCESEDLDRAYYPDSARVVLLDSETEGERARVEVEVISSSGGPFDSSEYTEKHIFRLVRSGGTWLLGGAPWPLYDCPGGPP